MPTATPAPLPPRPALDPRANAMLAQLRALTGARTDNLARLIAVSPSALAAWVGWQRHLGAGALSPQLRARIALAVAEASLSHYGLGAQAERATAAGLSGAQIGAARRAAAADPRDDAVLKFVRSVIVHRGQVPAADLAQARGAGLTDRTLVEVVACVTGELFANYLAHIFQPTPDHPAVETASACPRPPRRARRRA